MKSKVYTQEICTDCLLMLANGESDHLPEELERMNDVLEKWAKDGYTPAGLSDDCEPFFTWKSCDLCGQKAGGRFNYNFIQK